jgi:hypothetical protein
MASALAALANATATFHVAGTGTVTDPATGNVSAAGATVAVSLFLKAEKVTFTAMPGVDVVETSYSGYAIEPMALDPRIVIGTTGTLAFAGEDAVDCEVAELRLPYGAQGLVGGTLAGVLGQAVRLVARGQA